MTTSTATTRKPKLSALVRILGTTLFVSAFLLFWCEPMVGKMVLPLVGGTAAVWTTCILFFQIMLLAGYLYAHLLGQIKNIRSQFVIHGLVLIAALVFLPLHFQLGVANGSSGNPALWLLGRLLVVAGVPFFAVATNAPLLQNWLSGTTEESALDPYFLYAASNAGSLSALLVHPLLLESLFGVTLQARYWLVGYVALILLVGASALIIWTRWGFEVRQSRPLRQRLKSEATMKLYWVSVSFLPSALMLAVTNHISTNVTSAPFLWVIPLGVYLLTFILGFARGSRVSSMQASRTIPFVLLTLLVLPTIATAVGIPGSGWLMMGVHVILLFFSALLCHTALAEHRPDPQYLTEFYFWVAFGGVLGGVFTAILAPMMFQTVFEYPLLIVMILFFRRTSRTADNNRDEVMKWAVPAGIGGLTLFAAGIFRWLEIPFQDRAIAAAAIMFTLTLYQLRNRALPFALICLALVTADGVVLPRYIDTQRVYAGRNFFGGKTVLEDREHKLRTFVHGNTIHGVESTKPELDGQPLAYFHRAGPVGDVMAVMGQRQRQQVGVIGLGAGSMAAYASPTRPMTFFEIDSDVEWIARRYFKFLESCGMNCNVVIGDGRLQLEQVPERQFDLLVMDAFSSDAVPAHLVSREALKLYLSKLAPDGILLFNCTNRFLDISRLVSGLVTDAGLVAFVRRDSQGDLQTDGKLPSIYVVAARHPEDLASLSATSGWSPVAREETLKVWTDDYSSMLGILRLR